MKSAHLIALAILLSVACVPLASRADQASQPASGDAADDLARQHNAVGKKLFSLGLFAEAAREYEAAYKAKPLPAYLYNLGQCYRRMGGTANERKAIWYYKSYLRNDPESPARPLVEDQIAKLERSVAEAERPRPKPIYKKWWFWTIIGAAVTGAAIGTAVALRPEDQKPAAVTLGEYPVP